MTGVQPDLSDIREFGEKVYVLEEITKPKIEPKARKVIFTGFEDGPKAIRYYDENSRKIRVSRNFKFTIINAPITEKDPEDNDNNDKVFSDENRYEEKNIEEDLPEIVDTSRAQPRELRSTTHSGCSIRRNYADMVKFNSRHYIRQSKPYHSVYENPTKNGNDDLPKTIDEAREIPDKTNWKNAIQTELGMHSEKKTWEL
ncbi:hypothetical protein OnM2_065049, partial [Erysiphe neolycopersici]